MLAKSSPSSVYAVAHRLLFTPYVPACSLTNRHYLPSATHTTFPIMYTRLVALDHNGRTTMTLFTPDNTPETLTAAGLQPTSVTQGLRLENLDFALLASVLEASLDGFLLFNSELRCLSANLAACDILGRSLENVCGQHLLTLFADPNQETSSYVMNRA